MMILTTKQPYSYLFDMTYCVPLSFSLLGCISFMLCSCYRCSRAVTIWPLKVSIQQLISRVVWGQTYIRGLLKKQLHTVLVYPAIMLKFCTTKQILQSSLNFTCLTLQQIYLVLDTYIFLYITTDITWYRHTLY